MGPKKLSKRELLDYANSLPEDEPEDDGVAVHVLKVRTDDPKWGWLFGSGGDDENEDETEDETEDEDEDKKDPKPKSRNKYFGGK